MSRKITFDAKAFFDHCRATVMGPRLSGGEVRGANALLAALEDLPVAWVAYALATAWHETAHTLRPIKEFGTNAYFTRMYDITGHRPEMARRNGNVSPGDGVRFAGRGYVQLTWRDNYRRAGKILNVPLEDNPDLAMDPGIAGQILRMGMIHGWFTGRSFATYLPDCGPATREGFRRARRIINGTDRDRQIADYALAFQTALIAGNWAGTG